MTNKKNGTMTRREGNTILTQAMAAGVIGGSLAGCGSMFKPDANGGTTKNTSGVPEYRIYPLRNGKCKVSGHHAFEGGSKDDSYEYALYVWLILGGDKPMLVDAGLVDVAEMNKGAAKVLHEPISQQPTETVPAQLAKFGLTPADIGHVFITHLHFDHVDGLDAFTNAKIYIGKQEWTLATANDCRGSWGHGRIMFMLRDKPEWNRRLVLVEDEEIMPGFESFFVGGHTLGSTAYRVNTAYGKTVLTGDTVSLLANIEKDMPVGVFMDLDQCKPAMAKIRAKADVILPSHDPGTAHRWPPTPKNEPKYTIRAIKVGQCEVVDGITFQDRFHEDKKTRTYNLYVWLIEGGDKPILVETGPNPKYVEEFNSATAKYIPGGIKQTPDEDTLVALKQHGIDPAEVSHVIVTHLHGDHYDYYAAFANASFVINRTEYEEGKDGLKPDVVKAIEARPDALQIVDEEEIMPGIWTVHLGCHTNGSQGVLVRTHMGPVLLAGDVVSMYDNMEQNRPGRSPNPDACIEAMAKIRSKADLVLPAHDPETLKRWPNGVIGGPGGLAAW